MKFERKASAERKFGPVAQRAFLTHLARTANVSAAAKTAGVTTSPVYDLRKKSAAFQASWLAALSEGYAQLEAQLLAEALRPAATNMKDSTFRQRQMKIRLGTTLLAAHRGSVRGEAPKAASQSRDPAEVKKRLATRFAAMRQRLNDDDSAAQ